MFLANLTPGALWWEVEKQCLQVHLIYCADMTPSGPAMCDVPHPIIHVKSGKPLPWREHFSGARTGVEVPSAGTARASGGLML